MGKGYHLYFPIENQMEINIVPEEDDIPERRLTVVSSIATEDTVVDLNRFSSFTKAQRITACCLRFTHNSQM